MRLPPTRSDLLEPTIRPYFLWWVDCTVAQLRRHLDDPDPERRGYWLGALLREANSRDIWLFTTPDRVRSDWDHVIPHLGKERERWAWLLGLPSPVWPPADAR